MTYRSIFFLNTLSIRVSIPSPLIFWVAWFLIHHGQTGRSAIRPFVRLHRPPRRDTIITQWLNNVVSILPAILRLAINTFCGRRSGRNDEGSVVVIS